jgi:hypothetical protein
LSFSSDICATSLAPARASAAVAVRPPAGGVNDRASYTTAILAFLLAPLALRVLRAPRRRPSPFASRAIEVGSVVESLDGQANAAATALGDGDGVEDADGLGDAPVAGVS